MAKSKRPRKRSVNRKIVERDERGRICKSIVDEVRGPEPAEVITEVATVVGPPTAGFRRITNNGRVAVNIALGLNNMPALAPGESMDVPEGSVERILRSYSFLGITLADVAPTFRPGIDVPVQFGGEDDRKPETMAEYYGEGSRPYQLAPGVVAKEVVSGPLAPPVVDMGPISENVTVGAGDAH